MCDSQCAKATQGFGMSFYHHIISFFTFCMASFRIIFIPTSQGRLQERLDVCVKTTEFKISIFQSSFGLQCRILTYYPTKYFSQYTSYTQMLVLSKCTGALILTKKQVKHKNYTAQSEKCDTLAHTIKYTRLDL